MGTRRKQKEIEHREHISLTRSEIKFISWIREFGWGKVEIMVKDGEVVQSSVVRRDYRFDV